MHKISYWVVSTTFVFSIILFLFNFILYRDLDATFSIQLEVDIIYVIIFSLIALFSLSLLVRIVLRVKSIKPESLLILYLFLFFISLAAIFAVFSQFIVFEATSLQYLWFSMSTISLNTGMFFLNYLNIEMYMKGVNYKHNSSILLILGIYVIILNVFSQLLSFGYSEAIYIINFSGQFGIAFLAGFYLFLSGFTVMKKVLERQLKRGFLFQGFAGLSFILGFLLNFIYSICNTLEISLEAYFLWIMWGLWAIGIVFTYFGFTIPIPKRNRRKPIKQEEVNHD